MSHRIKRFAAFAIFASFYLFAVVDSISGLLGHQMDTKLDTKFVRRNGFLSLSKIARLVSMFPVGEFTGSGRAGHYVRSFELVEFFLRGEVENEIDLFFGRQQCIPGSERDTFAQVLSLSLTSAKLEGRLQPRTTDPCGWRRSTRERSSQSQPSARSSLACPHPC